MKIRVRAIRSGSDRGRRGRPVGAPRVGERRRARHPMGARHAAFGCRRRRPSPPGVAEPGRQRRKFTSRGHVLIAVDCLERSADRALVRITVEDTGIGIRTGRAKGNLSEVHPGRRFHHPPLRRHRAGLRHQQGTGPVDGRPGGHAQHAWRRIHVLVHAMAPGSRRPQTVPGPGSDFSRRPVLVADPQPLKQRVLQRTLDALENRS